MTVRPTGYIAQRATTWETARMSAWDTRRYLQWNDEVLGTSAFHQTGTRTPTVTLLRVAHSTSVELCGPGDRP